MSLTAFFRDVKDRWRTFVQVVWPERPEEARLSELDRLNREITARGRRLVALRQRIDRLLDKLGRQLGRLRELSARLLLHKDESASAGWERLQQVTGRKRVRLDQLERRYEEECAELDQLRDWRRALGQGRWQCDLRDG